MSSPTHLDLETACITNQACRGRGARRYILLAAAVLACGSFLLMPASLTMLRTAQVVDITTIRSSHQCLVENGKVENRVCSYQNLILHAGDLLYIHEDAVKPQLPDVMVNWHHDIHLQLISMPALALPEEITSVQAELIAKATLTHRQWHLNYGHSIAESVFEVYNTACVYLQSCSLSKTQLVPVFLDRPGSFGWTGAKGNWKSVLPPAAEALQCFFPKPALWIADTALHSRVFVLEQAVAGIGLYNRKWPGPKDVAARFKSFYGHVNSTVAELYRQGIAECTGIRFQDIDATTPTNVTIVNRQYHAGRHIVNTEDITNNIQGLQEFANCRVVNVEKMSLAEQVKLYRDAQILVMTHGASIANIMFMSPGSVVVVYNWVKRNDIPHSWVTALIKDMSLPVNFVGTSTDDRRFLFPQKEKYVFQPGFADLAPEAKTDLLEKGICPENAALQDCNDMKMNFAIDWNELKPALLMAVQDMQPQHTHVLDRLDAA